MKSPSVSVYHFLEQVPQWGSYLCASIFYATDDAYLG